MDEQVKSDTTKVDIEIVKAFASAAIRAVKQQCAAEIKVGQPFYKKDGFPTPIDVASFIDLEAARFKGTMALSYPRGTFLAMIHSMTGESHTLINASVRDGASELLNIIYGEVKSVFNAKGYALPMAIPQVLLADAAIEKLESQKPAVIVPFETAFGSFFAQIGLPRAVAAKAVETPVGAAISSAPAGGFPASTRILVVDDMSTMRKVVRRALNSLGYSQIGEAADGQQGWDELTRACQQGKPYDLVLSDWNMPVMKGIDFLKKVRANINTRGTPFILVTAESELDQIMNAVKLGANAYILKPFTAESVAAKLLEVHAKLAGAKKAA